MTLVLRIVVAVWGIAFGLMALQGIFNPAAWTEGFGVTAQPEFVNNLRADYGSFFLIAALGALWGALQLRNAKALWVPAALFGGALTIRVIGLAMGDPLTEQIRVAMAVELISVLLMLFAARHFSKTLPQ